MGETKFGFDYMVIKTQLHKYMLAGTAIVLGIFSYTALYSRIDAQEGLMNNNKLVQHEHAASINKLDSYEVMIKSNAKTFDKFFVRFDEFLYVQTKMNKQLIELSARQEIILMQVGK